MGNVPGPEHQKALEDVGLLCFLRSRTELDEQEIADKLQFGGPEHMYVELEKLGLPPWVVRPPGQQTQDEKPEKKRRGSGKGEPIELPPAKEAAPLFKESLDKLLEAVEFLQSDYESASSSRKHKEYLQGGLFVQHTRDDVHPWNPPPKSRSTQLTP
jgi:hypothetical protein